MSDSISFSMTGVDELNKKLESITDDLKKKGGRFALRKAAQKIRDKAKQNAARIDDPQTAENIEKNIVERWDGKLFKRTGDLGFRVGVLGGAGGNKSSDAFAGLPGGDTRMQFRQQEFGNSLHPAQPFMRPAAEQAGQEAVDEFMAQYGKAIDRAIARGKK